MAAAKFHHIYRRSSSFSNHWFLPGKSWLVHYPTITTTKVPQLQIFSSVVMGLKLCLFKDPDELELIPELLSAREHIPPALFLFYTYVMDVCCNGYHSSAMKVFQFCLISGTPRENMTFHRHALKKYIYTKKKFCNTPTISQ